MKKNYYTAKEIGILLGITDKSVRNKLSKLGLQKVKTDGFGKALYSNEQIKQLNYKPNDIKNKYYPIYTETIYHIYESKMNNVK